MLHERFRTVPLTFIPPFSTCLSPGNAASPVYATGEALASATFATHQYICPHSGCVLLHWLRLDNRDELVAALGQQHRHVSDAALVIAAYQRWQADCVARLRGDFAFALYDPHRQHMLLARDAVGVRPLYYLRQTGHTSVALQPAHLLPLAETPLDTTDDWLIRYLLDRSASLTDTAYPQLKKLPPAHLAVVTADGMQLRRYMDWDLASPVRNQRDPQWVADYRQVLKQAVQRRLPTGQKLGCENSGGIDSATLLGLAAGQHDPSAIVSMGLCDMQDETPYILATSQQHGVTQNHLLTRQYQCADQDIDLLLNTLAYPAEHPVASESLSFYHLSRQHSLPVLFSGFGGDEVVTSQGAILLQELATHGQWRALWHTAPGNTRQRLWQLAKRGLRQLPFPLPRRSPASELQTNWQWQPLQPDLLAQASIRAIHDDRGVYDTPHDSINAFAVHSRLTAPYVATRLETCSLAAACFGVEYRWPLLDQQLIQQYLHTPAIEKYGPDSMGRYLHRRAIEGVVPPMVQWRRSKDMGFRAWFQQQLVGPELTTRRQALHAQLDQLSPRLQALVDQDKLRRIAANIPHYARFEDQLRAYMSIYQVTQRLQWLNRWLARTA